MARKTWNKLTKDQRREALPLLFSYLKKIRLKPPADKADSNQISYMKRKMESMFKANSSGPEILDSLIFTVDDSGVVYCEFRPLQSWNSELMELMYFFTDTQPRIENGDTSNRTSPL